jgi:hypothetical protein
LGSDRQASPELEMVVEAIDRPLLLASYHSFLSAHQSLLPSPKITRTSETMPVVMTEINGRREHRNEFGRFHRDDGPAYEVLIGHDAGAQQWYQNGTLHREDGPAWISPGPVGYEKWYFRGQCHREDGPAVKYANGDFEWFLNGSRHRIGGPAYKVQDAIAWYKNNVLDREDGPAYIYPNGQEDYYLMGRRIDKKEFIERIRLIRRSSILEAVESFANHHSDGSEKKLAKAGKALFEFLTGDCSHLIRDREGNCHLCDHGK